MRAVYLSTRLAGTDGVSLETAKMATVLEGLGFETVYCAGELDQNGRNDVLIPEMHFRDEMAQQLGARAFNSSEHDSDLEQAIRARADYLKTKILAAVRELKPDLLIMQNVWAIPMQLPLAKALADVVRETGLPCLSHEHDYYWERERFKQNRIPAYLDSYFPFAAANVRHLCINQPAQHDLMTRRGLEAAIIPNVFDFDTPAPGIDSYNADFRAAIGLSEGQRLFLQPTRVVPRKGIELAIDLLAKLADPDNVLVITHHAGDEGLDYLRKLERYAKTRQVDMRYVADKVDDLRTQRQGEKIYSLWDSYPHANFVTYPSLYEGFGNALIETVYFRKPALVNRYSVYVSDITPKGFDFIEIGGQVTTQAVEAVAKLLDDPAEQKRITEHNYQLGQRYFSYKALRELLLPELKALGFQL